MALLLNLFCFAIGWYFVRLWSQTAPRKGCGWAIFIAFMAFGQLGGAAGTTFGMQALLFAAAAVVNGYYWQTYRGMRYGGWVFFIAFLSALSLLSVLGKMG